METRCSIFAAQYDNMKCLVNRRNHDGFSIIENYCAVSMFSCEVCASDLKLNILRCLAPVENLVADPLPYSVPTVLGTCQRAISKLCFKGLSQQEQDHWAAKDQWKGKCSTDKETRKIRKIFKRFISSRALFFRLIEKLRH